MKEKNFPIYDTSENMIIDRLKCLNIIRHKDDHFTCDGERIDYPTILEMLTSSLDEYNRNIPKVNGEKITEFWNIFLVKKYFKIYLYNVKTE